jgi:hypothetical protein
VILQEAFDHTFRLKDELAVDKNDSGKLLQSSLVKLPQTELGEK